MRVVWRRGSRQVAEGWLGPDHHQVEAAGPALVFSFSSFFIQAVIRISVADSTLSLAIAPVLKELTAGGDGRPDCGVGVGAEVQMLVQESGFSVSAPPT